MDCPHCGSARTFKRGSLRAGCSDCRKTFNQPIPSLAQSDNLPEGVQLRGTSTLTDMRDGTQVLQWVKTSAAHDAQVAAMRALAAELCENVKGKSRLVALKSKRQDSESLSAYMIGDAHIGAYSWAEETGNDFDIDIASRDIKAAIDLLVDGSPASETGYLVDVGDFLHADDRSNKTPEHGNVLDVDSRFPKVRRVARDVLKYCVGRMLEKHDHVEVFQVIGNHNPESAGWMAMVIEAYFDNNPRVVVETSPSTVYYRKFGNVLIGMTHGDKVKMAELPSIMAYDRASDWGQTEYRYWWTGHIHHTVQQEYRGCFVEAFNTLAAGDAWHASSGYRAARQMQRIDINRETGIYNRGIANLSMARKSVEAA